MQNLGSQMNPLEALAPHSIWGMMRTYNDFIGFRAKHSRGYIGVFAAILAADNEMIFSAHQPTAPASAQPCIERSWPLVLWPGGWAFLHACETLRRLQKGADMLRMPEAEARLRPVT